MQCKYFCSFKRKRTNHTTACAHYCLNWPLVVGAAVELNQRSGAGISDNGSQVSSFWRALPHRAPSHSVALGAEAPKDAVAIEVVIIVLPWRRCVPNSALTRECSLVNYRQSRRSSVRLPHCSVSLSDKFHASPASNNHYVLLCWQLDNKSTRPSVIEHARSSLITCVVIFLWGCKYQKINKFTALQRDSVRIQFGSRSTWLFSILEGDRNLADLARQWSRGGWGGSWLGGARESESHWCLGFHPALAAPVHQISFTQQIPPWWETVRGVGGSWKQS